MPIQPCYASATSPRVVQLYENGDEGLMSRLRAEIQIAGFRVRRISQRAPLVFEDALAENGDRPIAALFVRQDDEDPDAAWTIDLVYRTPDHRIVHLQMPFPTDIESRQLTALHLADILRVAFPPPPMNPISADPSDIESDDRSPLDQLTGQVSGIALFPSLTRPPQVGALLGFGYQPHRWFGIRILGTLPITPVPLREPEADADVRVFSVGAAASLIFGQRRLRPALQAGWMCWFFRATITSSTDQNRIPSTDVLTGPFTSMGVLWMLSDRIAIDLSGMTSITTARVRYRMNDRHVADMGRPLFGALLGVTFLSAEVR